jgi:hypothetical protein
MYLLWKTWYARLQGLEALKVKRYDITRMELIVQHYPASILRIHANAASEIHGILITSLAVPVLPFPSLARIPIKCSPVASSGVAIR